jgi:SpoVK/Ycf46/Vps4 family AAA+-type ATPase
LRERKFALLDVEKLIPIKPNPEGFRDLPLPKGHKEMVQALVRSHAMKTEGTTTATIDYDLVKGKGQGLIILLHGVPGVGKTSTAKCVAQSTGRPLLLITCGDLGLTPEDVKKRLGDIFNLAQAWDCVLLLDEADVFLA